MIAKRVMRGKAGDFGRLGEYIVHGQKGANESRGNLNVEELAIWQRTADYIVDAIGGGMRATAVRISNCYATDIEMAIHEIIATQARNHRAKGDKTYHLVVSFPPGEKPTPEQLADIENELCKAIGLGEHQRISAVHTDTQHLHMHIAINQVHPQKLTRIEPFYDKRKLMAACDRLEIKHGLTRTNHSKVHLVRDAGGAGAMGRYGSGSTLLAWLRCEVRPRLLEVLAQGQGWQDLHAILQDHGLAIRRRGAGLVIVKNNGRVAVKASNVDRLLAMKALQDRWGDFVPADPEITTREPKYRRARVHRDVDELFEDWLRQRDELNVDMDKLNIQIKHRHEKTTDLHYRLVDNIHRCSPLNGLGRSHEYRMLQIETDGRRRKDREWAKSERTKLLARLPTWPELLREAALIGNTAALRTLRRNARRFQKALNAVTGEDTSPDAKASLTTELKPETHANGHITYRLRDGGKVVDDGKAPSIENFSHNAIALTLALTASRAPGQGIVITQPDKQAETIEVAARDRLNITFKDRTAEQERQRLSVVFEREDAALASAVFIARMNGERANKPDTPEHRLWCEADVGETIFERVEALGDDTHAALLRRNGEMLVKPLIAAEVSTFSGHNPGDVIQVLAPPEAQPVIPVVEEAQVKPKKSWWRR